MRHIRTKNGLTMIYIIHMKKCVKSAIKWCYEHCTLQGLLFTIQLIVVIGWVVCLWQSLHAGTPELTKYYRGAAITHVDLSWVCTFFILLSGFFKFGRTQFFPKFIAYNAKD